MYSRKKSGKGFSYRDENNSLVDKKTRKWIESLIIPPAWKFVEISEDQKAKILAVGRDEKNRKQYIYHPQFREAQNQKKFDRILEFAENLEHMRRVTGQHLRKRKMTQEKVLATMVRLLDTAYFRPGNDSYSKKNSTYGLTTIRSKHLKIENDELIFSYVGKSHKKQERHVVDKKLANIVAELDELPGYKIFKFYNENSELVDVNSHHLNQYIHEVMGEEFSAKDFRTWGGTMVAALALEELGVSSIDDQKNLDKKIKDAVIKVSEILGNTPAVARSSYIDPRIIEAYTEGKNMYYFKKEIEKLLKKAENLSKEEIGVLCILKEKLKSN
ncbi:DNA topoisomerase IB [Frigoriflavimonas asaccharolytica]|uniref:DNA topoisomerase n=1 Tax=Frigoriflavimonas asaccharolytica TaxID=2735899 RepID=A0A8J8G702_9FLAO|nr:DNA topoisomerase IB [Frigoriflavimonas asaccharolytica]NRS91850.1 DNA topoisomerase-1 [Frigoriflavimonas asaccharolytica]